MSDNLRWYIMNLCLLCLFYKNIPRRFILDRVRADATVRCNFWSKSESKGGLDLGTLNASMVILGLFLMCFGIEMYQLSKSEISE